MQNSVGQRKVKSIQKLEVLVMLEEKKKVGFIENFLAIAEREPDLAAIEVHGEEQALTYAGLLKKAEYWQGDFRMMEVEKNDMVLILLPSSSELIASFYALVSTGGIAVPVSHDVTAYELEQILVDTAPKGVITNQTIFTSMSRSFCSISSLRFIFVIDGVPKESLEGERVKIIGMPSMAKQRIPISVPTDNPIVCCQYTYKGLGYPLGVLHRYDDYTNGIECLKRILITNPGAVYLSVLPIHYVYSFTMMVLFPLSYGCKLVIVQELKNNSLLELLERYHISICCMVPMLLEKLVSEASAMKKEKSLSLTPNLRIFSGGSLLDSSLSKKVFETIGIEPFQGYGLTETLPVTANYPEGLRRGSIGLPLSEEIAVYIMDEHGCQVPAGQTGEIVVGGFTVTEGFYNHPKETIQFLRDGLFYTGDLGFIDNDGFLFFVGRKCPITKVVSKMTDLTEIENVLLVHPDVIKARVSVYKNSLLGENIMASLVLKKDSLANKVEFKHFCRERLSRHKVPSKFKIYVNVS